MRESKWGGKFHLESSSVVEASIGESSVRVGKKQTNKQTSERFSSTPWIDSGKAKPSPEGKEDGGKRPRVAR